MPTQAACHKTKNTAFINPNAANPAAVRAAITMCEQCPIRRECAQNALTSGSGLNDSGTAPASDVIQAGVVCYGDFETMMRLSQIAEREEVPTAVREHRAQAPDRCRNCHQPMVKWHRAITPEGYVKHYARGFCTECRSAYTAWKRENNVRSAHRGLRKHIDRKRHSAPPKRNTVLAVQMPLFEAEV